MAFVMDGDKQPPKKGIKKKKNKSCNKNNNSKIK